MGKIRGQRFTEETDKIISDAMKKWGHLPNPYVKICGIIPNYSSKQIRYRWISKLNPSLCNSPLDEDEKLFIVQWVENNKTPYGIIHWRDLINEVKNNFGKLRSENTLKNFWHLRRRSLNQKKVNYDSKLPSNYVNEKDIYLFHFKKDDDENIPSIPLNANPLEILCSVAEELYKRDFP
ncbi:hypothetical protein C1645_809818 [Glomus cerebriforme]|uniref:HTH myb-type domain-containing protein n=1 Tax=Glomus cerebriforme TaxID=658196 RepID=A0A397S6J6_9GLOM|nr:hypothetical protein C1645_809818 [Glomus cerebriforme]